MSRPVLVFAYGTLCEAAVFRRVTGTLRPLDLARPAVLPGWRRVVLRGTPYPTLVRDSGGETNGRLLAVTPAVLRRLHIYEGPAYRFLPVMVHVPARGGSTRWRAHAWIAANADPATPWP